MARQGSARKVGANRLVCVALLPAIGLLVASCGSGTGDAASTNTSRAGTSTTASGGREAVAGASPFFEVKTGNVPGLGTVLVDGQDLTLYMFEPDGQSGRSTCYSACAEGWPPLRLPTGTTEPVAGGRAEPSLLGTTARKDGGLQVTYNGWPLYLWVGDSGPGQATGQGLNNAGGVWYVLSPRGAVIKTG